MYIKEITIDGFKSYAQRVVIPGFDPQFNAITGLNGSGKSNILDSICFVLGIQNLQQVRASNLQDLVYKQGQAGVTKATVSIVFDNSTKDRSPVGYDHLDEITVTRQLVIGGRSKYLINGKVAEPSRVQNLFHSVQLNVNNPHFLIMQGRITKVLSMKPPEILGLIEEAAGTKMYESKKQAALRTLDKKQVKLEEINRVLQEDIMPALDKLRGEKTSYMEWQGASARLDRLRRFCVAYRFVEAERLLQDGTEEIARTRGALNELESAARELELALREREDEIQGLETEKDLQSSGEIKELTTELDEVSKRLVKETATWNHQKEALAAEQVELERLQKALQEVGEDELAARKQAAETSANESEQAAVAAAEALAAAQAELEGVQSGDGRDGSGKSLQERLADAKNEQTAAKSAASQAVTRATHLKNQLAEKKSLLKAQSRAGSKLAAELESAEKAVSTAQRKLSSLQHDEQAYLTVQKRQAAAQDSVRKLRASRDDLAARLPPSLSFPYSPPETNWDASRVKGVVASLVRVQDPSTATALEVVAGGRLYQVVVDTEATAKALLSKGKLRQRVTIVPLNRVSGRDVGDAARKAAASSVGDRAMPAMELVGYDAQLGPAMRYAFGGSFVCRDVGAAKKLAFSREVNTRSVTLEGDEFNPAGTLTGGARAKGAGVLSRLHDLHAAERELESAERELESAIQELRVLERTRDAYVAAQEELELARQAAELLRTRERESEAGQLETAVTELQTELAEAEEQGAKASAQTKELQQRVADLQAAISTFAKDRNKLVAEMKTKVQAAKKACESAKSAARSAAAKLAAVVAETEAAVAERTQLESAIAACDAGIIKLTEETLACENVVATSKAVYDDLAGRLAACKARLQDCDKEIAAAKKARQAVVAQLAELGGQKKKAAAKIDNIKRGMEEGTDRAAKLEKEFPWIPSERSFFGQAGTDYDFAAVDADKSFAEYEAAERSLESLSRRVNKKVMAMFDKAESEYNELRRKRDVVEGDKQKIHQVMDELDEKKREALEATWRKVNGDFGAIFGTLLPGTSAKLEPPEGETFLEGLEVRVAFGGVWKQSLSELSGGQKSLLALSLILAMLLFKPAPIYILDEVDAALDLSHTQNIGRMIKAHFPQSQFVVVSLKEGMFNNANVLFRTKFVDGVSTVARTTTTSGDSNKQAPRARKGIVEIREPLRENVGHV